MKIGLKTTLGVFAAAIGYLSGPAVIGTLGHVGSTVVTIAGTVLSVLGLRDAIAKNGNGS